jgi:hypothetical protein
MSMALNLHFYHLCSYIEYGIRSTKHLADPSLVFHIFLLDMSQPKPGNNTKPIKPKNWLHSIASSTGYFHINIKKNCTISIKRKERMHQWHIKLF